MNRNRIVRIAAIGFVGILALFAVYFAVGTVLGTLGIDVHFRWPPVW